MQCPCCIVDPMCCNSSIGPLVSACPVISSPHNLVIADLPPLCCLNCKSTHFKYWNSDFLVSKFDNLFGFWIERDKTKTMEWRLRECTKRNALLNGKSPNGSPVKKPCILHFELDVKPGIFAIDVGRTPSSLDFLVVLSTRLAIVSYLAGWWCRLWAQRLLVDWLSPTLIISASGFLRKVEHSLHSTYSLYSVRCCTGINSSNPAHHAELFLKVTFIVKYLVTLLMTLLAPSLLSKLGAWVACKDESTPYCRLLSLTWFTCFSRLVSEMAGGFCCLFEMAGCFCCLFEMAGCFFRCFFCLLCWSSPLLLLCF